MLWIGEKRTEKSFRKFFDLLGEKSKDIQFVCSDMWKPYLKVIKERASQALNILDRFHIVARLNKALDEVRASEHKKMKEDGYELLLTKARWPLLKNAENLKSYEKVKLRHLIVIDSRMGRNFLLGSQGDAINCNSLLSGTSQNFRKLMLEVASFFVFFTEMA